VPPCLRKGSQSHCDAKSDFGMFARLCWAWGFCYGGAPLWDWGWGDGFEVGMEGGGVFNGGRGGRLEGEREEGGGG